MDKVKIGIILLIVVVVAGIVGIWLWQNYQPSKLDSFAQCLKDSGAKFYGAFWCSHCQNQKAEFGSAKRLLPYIECSTPDGKGQLKVCKDANIEGYPTWEFVDSSRVGGEMSLQALSEKTNCQLPN
mgnify:CR=1 FL=1